ncbi:heat-inducible transcriptional repressor HrcA [Pullulanibacillus sp. KACC 23026]|uniref:heat-inducible transcriptional repressor HrcA n=1 Tax=Pullulanibacillus sp. KACC 23026 TaxID=3028315 RepID=UPI0023AEDCC7|nr:heat-inducible transcriptional repressor HrcA [Pullulanibacillus sp. KACC 23026]WEG14219.1 heat-inducible transcriptional repressor HrcA [Pullulanibacillus sp. KACC 23026]
MLTDRQLFLFQLLVDDYIRSAEPIGSRTISKRDDVTISSATIRNELADLEEMGYLEKPHSSSGRVPSEKGYRFYVDHLLSPELLTNIELTNIRKAFKDRYYEVEKLIQETATLLSEFTNYTSIVVGPEVLETKLKQLQIIPLSYETAVLIIVTNTGHVENRTVSFPSGVSTGDIEKLVRIVNEKLQGVPLYALKNALQTELNNLLRAHIKNYSNAIRFLDQAFTYSPIDSIFFGGKTNMLSQPEFKDIDKVLPLLNVLEKKERVYELLRNTSANGIQIKIGHENELLEARDCSLITATYSIGGEHMGTLAVIGPTRMMYPRVVSLMDQVSKGLSKFLTERYQKD